MQPEQTAQPEPKPFEKFRQFAKQVISVPKKEIERREAGYKKEREAKRPQGTVQQ